MSSRFPLRALWAALSLAAPAFAQAGGDGFIDPLQTQTCNEPPPLAGLGDFAVQIKGKNLTPGSQRLTPGTSAALSTELDGIQLDHTEPVEFSFDAGPGWVTGSYEEIIVKGTDDTCKTHLRVTVTSGCIVRLVFQNYRHPLGKKLVANYRLDLFPEDGGIPPHDAQRSSGQGRTVAFNLDRKVCGHAFLPQNRRTRWLLLNTSATAVSPRKSLVLVPPPGGASSPAYSVHVPTPQ